MDRLPRPLQEQEPALHRRGRRGTSAQPTYSAAITSYAKALTGRAGMVAQANDFMLRRKVAAGVAAVRRTGTIHAFDSLKQFFLAGEGEGDQEAMATIETPGRTTA